MHEQHFQIENFRFVKDNRILVSIVRGKLSIPITIPKEQYELWLLTAQRLITVMVLNEPQQTAKQVDTVMNKDEYWNLPDAEIHEDLYDYIVSHSINYRGVTYERSLTSINWAFNNHRPSCN